MKTKLLIASIALIGHTSFGQTVFNYTGAEQVYVVPPNVTTITIEAYGAQGGTADGGEGGYAYGELDVTPGQSLYIYVGGQGSTTDQGSGLSYGGWNGGGNGGSGTSGSSGGGASDVRVGGNALADRVIVAGGGGGMDYTGSSNTPGGDGGGTVGMDAQGDPTLSTGGTQSAGGVGGSANGYTANDGALGVGGATVYYSSTSYQYGGGGGGGYYGGAGGHPWCSGAGGSSYIGGVNNGSTTTGGRTGNGQVVITVPGCSGLDVGVTQNGQTLTADLVGATYQWLDCGNSYSVIMGETNQSYTPSITGNYAVEVTSGGCTDTSVCVLVDYSSLNELYNSSVTVYPNPSKDGKFKIDADHIVEVVEVVDMLGRSIKKEVIDGMIDCSDLENGKYIIRFKIDNWMITRNLVILK